MRVTPLWVRVPPLPLSIMLSKKIRIENIGKSSLAYMKEPSRCFAEYYSYCAQYIKQALNSDPAKELNVSLGAIDVRFPNNRRPFKIGMQCEHTIVRKEGIGGPYQLDNLKDYQIQIDRFDEIRTCDAIIDYSLPNLVNLSSSIDTRFIFEKTFYIPPLLYEYQPQVKARSLESISNLTVPPDKMRRQVFLSRMQKTNLPFKNINDWRDQQTLMTDAKVMVNVHQTDRHHTLEELRILPALLCGMIVISEPVPIRKVVPYSEYIIWSSFRGLPKKIKHVLENYDQYRKKIHGEGSGLADIIKDLTKKRDYELARMFESV